jgi:dihydrofolate reductase
MNVTLWMAMSLNGHVARENQSEDFLSARDWELFLELVRASDVVIWGRVTHELFERQLRLEFKERPIIVVTRNSDFVTRPGSIRAATPEEAVGAASRLNADNALLAGGSQLNAGFARSGLIDEVIVAIEPVIVSRGIPLLADDAPDLQLDLLDIDRTRQPTVRARYRVLRGWAAREPSATGDAEPAC